MSWALVERGVVRELRGSDPAGHYHADVPWVADAPDGVAVGWTYADGKFSAPKPPAPLVPQVVSAFQARAALLARPGKEPGKTLLDDVSAAVAAAASSNPVAAVAYEYATTWARRGALVQSLSEALGLTDAEVDALFIAAAKISA